ncbi:hypothetical protein MMC10_006993 [Thelotrema lepadinum]|nr:hypothetical protein [Thelotrema lepadinum]
MTSSDKTRAQRHILKWNNYDRELLIRLRVLNPRIGWVELANMFEKGALVKGRSRCAVKAQWQMLKVKPMKNAVEERMALEAPQIQHQNEHMQGRTSQVPQLWDPWYALEGWGTPNVWYEALELRVAREQAIASASGLQIGFNN